MSSACSSSPFRSVPAVTSKAWNSCPTIRALFFGDSPPTRSPALPRLGRPDIDIPPGVSHHVVEDSYELPVDVAVLALKPHAHYRAREIRGLATLPDKTVKWLLYIKDWDF